MSFRSNGGQQVELDRRSPLLAAPDNSRPSPPGATCDLSGLTDADIATVDDLARLQLITRRLGLTVELRNAPAELRELLELAGLGDVVRCSAPLPLEAGRQPEEGEEPRRVEEEADPRDPIA
jgi:ABC-type transporter Mla MlaB component